MNEVDLHNSCALLAVKVYRCCKYSSGLLEEEHVVEVVKVVVCNPAAWLLHASSEGTRQRSSARGLAAQRPSVLRVLSSSALQAGWITCMECNRRFIKIQNGMRVRPSVG